LPRLPDVARVVEPLIFTVSSAPVPKGRPRGYIRNGKVLMYTPEETRLYEAHVRNCALEGIAKRWQHLRMVYPDLPMKDHEWPSDSGYFRLTLDVYIKDKRRSDLSNYQKSIEDGCIGVVYRDDSHIHAIVATRHLDKDRPRVEVRVDVIPPCWSER
jgi:Holliday junction resolvase RusA-like endonuclease